jgi:ABC-type multidrug transport system fused ATPase/permease subunit
MREALEDRVIRSRANDHGRIVEHDSHDELVGNGAGHARVFALQAEDYR